MWTAYIKDQTARSVQSDLDLHCPQKFLGLSTVGKELKRIYKNTFEVGMTKNKNLKPCLFFLFYHKKYSKLP